MSDQTPLSDVILPDGNADLQTVLSAWHSATVRLEETHGALREEVRRLTDALEVKNRELARKNRLADLGQMASHVAHEVRNSLVPVTLYLSLLRRRLAEDPGSLDVLDKISAGCTALDATVHDLLHFTSDREPQCRTFALRGLIENVHASLAPQFSAQSIEPINRVPGELRITADQDMLRRAVLNLTLNALDAMPDGGSLTVTSSSAAGVVELQVADTGTGLAADAICRAFEPFFTTKCGGTGLGLAIVYRIMEVHRGEVAVANRPEGGAVFTLRIPQAASQEAAA